MAIPNTKAANVKKNRKTFSVIIISPTPLVLVLNHIMGRITA